MPQLRARSASLVTLAVVALWIIGCAEGPPPATVPVTEAAAGSEAAHGPTGSPEATPAPRSTDADSAPTQTVLDAAGDVKGPDGQAPPIDRAFWGDIDRVQFGLEGDAIVVGIHTTAEVTRLIADEQLTFVLAVRNEGQAGYEVSSTAAPTWGPSPAWGPTYVYDADTTMHTKANEGPVAEDGVVRLVVPLAALPRLSAPCLWHVESHWHADGALFGDRAPDAAPEDPAELRYPPAS